MVRLWKIMFDLVITMSVGVLLRLWGAVKKNRLCKIKQKINFLKIHKITKADKNRYILSFLKVHFFYKGFCNSFVCFCFVFLSVHHASQLYGCRRQCGRPVGARCSMGFWPNTLINGLIQHTFKLNILLLEKITVIHFDWTKLFPVHHKSP